MSDFTASVLGIGHYGIERNQYSMVFWVHCWRLHAKAIEAEQAHQRI